jgi:hypothetical protein
MGLGLNQAQKSKYGRKENEKYQNEMPKMREMDKDDMLRHCE